MDAKGKERLDFFLLLDLLVSHRYQGNSKTYRKLGGGSARRGRLSVLDLYKLHAGPARRVGVELVE